MSFSMVNTKIKQIVSRKVITVTPTVTVAEAIAIMSAANISCLVVTEDEKPVGIFTERDVVKWSSRNKPFRNDPISGLMTSPVMTISENMSVYEAYDLMHANNIRHHVIADRAGKIVGIMSQSDLINILGLEYFIEVRKIKQVMTTEVTIANRGDSVQEILSRMARQKISCVVVTEDQHPLGIFTERDAARLVAGGADLSTVMIGTVMSSPVLTVHDGTTVHKAAMVMKEKKIRRVVVIDHDGRVTGIVTQSDIIKGLEGKYIETLKHIIREKEAIIRKTSGELQDKTIYLDNILSSSIDMAIVATDKNLRIKYYNDVAEKVLGYEASFAIGRSALEMHAMEGIDPRRLANAWKIVRENGKYSFTSKVVKDGATRRFNSNMSAIRDHRNKLIGYVLIMHDITERSQLEDQLRQAQKMEAMGLLAGGIAHDFNNILTVIIGFGNLSLLDLKDHSQRANIQSMLDAADRAAKLTSSLLTFSRKQRMAPGPINLNAVISYVEKFLKRIIGEDIQLVTKSHRKEVIIHADSGQIEQVLMNLATNARDAMPNGGFLTIETEFFRMDEAFINANGFGKPGKYALLIVTDSGTGMTEEVAQRIFEPFFTTKGVGSGTGLGLAMVYGIIQQHNGFIQADSAPGKGTVFKIYLPLIEQGIVSEESTIRSYPEGGQETILVAEDDPDILKMIARILSAFGYVVITARNGEDAVARFMQHRDSVKLLLFDVIMPKKNGPDAYDEIKAAAPQVKVLFMSGYTADILQERQGTFAEDNIVRKPMQPLELVRKVRETLDA